MPVWSVVQCDAMESVLFLQKMLQTVTHERTIDCMSYDLHEAPGFVAEQFDHGVMC